MSTKMKLRRFVLRAAKGFDPRTASREFTAEFLECFGWDELPQAVPATLKVLEHAERTTREVALWWPERRVLIDVADRDVMLDFAWKGLLHACLQIEPTPQYVVLTNGRDVHLYDLASDKDTPRLSIAVDELPKYSEAFVFLRTDYEPGMTPQIINVERVSAEVADLVAKLYRSLITEHADDRDCVVRFTLQCILTMFAEDIGLLPTDYFTTQLYAGAEAGDVDDRLRELFLLMSTPATAAREVPYFNGGLFSDPVTLALGHEQLRALTKAAEANWSYVDPHIFGSVFQGIMDDAQRHASGAHYTAREDIMRVVGPTIVEPWRARLNTAQTLSELRALRKELGAYRVLDPACGSGNFLYVAYRELYRLETELLSRMREFSSAEHMSWGSAILTTNFFGIDINPFAVELARATLNIAKKIAFDERMETIAELYGQAELVTDPSLPLDNLSENIVCADALLGDWPQVEAIVGNPPFLGDRKIRGELGSQYVSFLKETFGVGVVDLCCYWFRLAHDRLRAGSRAGLVATSGIRLGKSREASLDYIVDNGGTICQAVSERPWPGDAVVRVSMVNWVRGDTCSRPPRLVVGDHVYSRASIAPHLQLHADVRQARELVSNRGGTALGVIFGTDAFRVPANAAARPELREFIRAVAAGTKMLTGALEVAPEYCLHISGCDSEAEARAVGAGYRYLEERVKPVVESKEDKYPGWLERWWQPLRPQTEFFGQFIGKRRFLACSNPSARPIFTLLSTRFLPTNTLQVFAYDDDYSFGVVQSSIHWNWVLVQGGRVESGAARYTSMVWNSFPWPQAIGEREVERVSAAARNLRETRRQLMSNHGWSLRDLYRAAEVEGPHPLKDAQATLDQAVAAAYGIPPDMEVTEFLLDLNLCLAEDEEAGLESRGPGLPDELDPQDPRWMSDDCIEPPPPRGVSDA